MLSISYPYGNSTPKLRNINVNLGRYVNDSLNMFRRCFKIYDKSVLYAH